MFELDKPTIETKRRYRALKNGPITLPAAEYQKLQEHLDECECALRPSSKLLAYVLANKLMNTQPAANVYHSDLVVGGSRVIYVIDDGEPRAGLLVHRARTALLGSVIPVASLLGATLIGMRSGERAPLLFEDGTIGRLCLVTVSK